LARFLFLVWSSYVPISSLLTEVAAGSILMSALERWYGAACVAQACNEGIQECT
jgi:hypothetical protein